MLICPKCGKKLYKTDNSYKCSNNHTYDISKEGYINLLLANQKKQNSGDNSIQVNARDTFLNNGFYYELTLKIMQIIKSLNIEKNSYILDSGCGTAYYLNILNSNLKFKFIGIDISKNAIKKAAKKNIADLLIVASITNIPILSNSVSLIYNIFSPYDLQEYNRVLINNGYFVNITPNEKHLYEIKDILYEKPYLNTNKFIDSNYFEIMNKNTLTYQKTLKNADIINLFTMTPYFYKTNETSKEKLFKIDKLEVTFDFNVTIYKKRN